MKTVKTLFEMRAARSGMKDPVRLVPTMGYLHAGHLSLVRQAQAVCRSVVVTIFVNPTQFGPGEDLEIYPRGLSRDMVLLEVAGCDLVWLPDTQEMYPPDFQTWVLVEEVTQYLEGERRPSHFRGVTTVVSKLFHAVHPHLAFFGQKDAQQAIVIQRMVRDLNFPIEMVICPIFREADGLAMSSRNSYLDPQQRKAAIALYRALVDAKRHMKMGNALPIGCAQSWKYPDRAGTAGPVAIRLCGRSHTLQELAWVESRAYSHWRFLLEKPG